MMAAILFPVMLEEDSVSASQVQPHLLLCQGCCATKQAACIEFLRLAGGGMAGEGAERHHSLSRRRGKEVDNTMLRGKMHL